MVYKKRLDGRDWEELRPIEAKAGVIPNADGSAYFRIGNFKRLAPRDKGQGGYKRLFYNHSSRSGRYHFTEDLRINAGGGSSHIYFP